MNPVRQFFSKRHGTERGYARHCLALLEYYTGSIDAFNHVEWSRVERIVFVCLGNICRSAYAHHYLLAKNPHIAVTSVGLSTTTGVGANALAISTACHRGIDLASHLTTNFEDFEVNDGDLFLTMEIRQAKRIRDQLTGACGVQIGLLGTLCDPPRPHLHDPFSLSAEYFQTCFSHIETAVTALEKKLTSAND